MNGASRNDKIAVNARYIKDSRGYDSVVSYAIALTKRLAIRKAQLQDAESVIVFEDDVVLSPDFNQKIEALNVPDDWQIFYFGCRHLAAPEPVAPGVVRCAKTWDNHAFAIKAELFRDVRLVMQGAGRGKGKGGEPSDRRLSRLGNDRPTYAAYPNLAWQTYSHSDHVDHAYTAYTAEGRQRDNLEVVDELEAKKEQVKGKIVFYNFKISRLNLLNQKIINKNYKLIFLLS